MRKIFILVEGEEPVEATRFLLNVIADVASLQLQDRQQASQVFFISSIVFSLLGFEMITYAAEEEEFAEELDIMEGTFYFQNGALMIQAEGSSDLVLDRIDGPATAVLSASWGYIKSQWP